MSKDIDWVLLGKYFAGECTPEEVQIIENWIESDPLKINDLDYLKKVWEASDKTKLNEYHLEDIDVQADWLLMQEKINSGKLAAAETSQAKLSPKKRDYKPAKISSPIWYIARVAAVILVLFGGGVLVSQLIPGEEESVTEQHFSEISTERGQRAGIQLRDGSKVNLSVDSKIRHSFNENLREVYIEGEAYFDVFRDPSRPFIIQSNHARVEVLGTDFSVKAYPDENYVQVAVVSGSVSVESMVSAERSNAVIEGGEIAILNIETGELTTEKTDTQKYTSWLQGKLVFEDVPITEVGRELERWFDINFVIENEELKSKRLTAVLDSKSLQNLLDVVGQTIGADYQLEENTVLIQ
ncbi:MAG: FecR domain-containing protein [Balneolaceae bacterium]